jgi:transcription elongation factor GreA
MDPNNKVLLTRDGLEALKREYKELTDTKRPEVVRRLSEARDLGDLSENSEYAAAKQDLSFIDGRMLELEEIIHGAKLISGNHTKSQVEVGCKVILHINGKRDEYTLVGEWEADPEKKKISHESPLGKALMGKKVGDRVEVAAPAGKVIYKILGIE